MRWILIIGKTSALDIYFQYYALAGLYIIEGKNQDALNISSHHRGKFSPSIGTESALAILAWSQNSHLASPSSPLEVDIVGAYFSLKKNFLTVLL